MSEPAVGGEFPRDLAVSHAISPNGKMVSPHALILAAGQGSRLQFKGPSKPLMPLLGVSLIERTVRTLNAAGIHDFYVVSGYRGDDVRPFLDELAERIEVRISHVENPRWSEGNATSLLAARESLPPDKPFLLSMCDHLVEPRVVYELISHGPDTGEVVLAVDRQLDNPLVDLADVTRVRSLGDRIIEIGKGLTDYDGFDTGFFCCTPALFEAVEQSIETSADDSLSGAIQQLANQSKAKTLDASGCFWIDVDTPRAAAQAERALLAHMRGKMRDGPVSRYLNRPFSGAISRRLANYEVTPNQISCLSFLLCVAAASLIAGSAGLPSPIASWACLAVGGLLAQLASVIDGCDGEIARLKFMQSDFGGWLDAVLDRYADALLLFAFLWRVYRAGDPLLSGMFATDVVQLLAIVVGFSAIVGSFMLSYTADKYDGVMAESFDRRTRFRVGRDVRILIIVLGALLNMGFLVLLINAVWMNAEVVRRVWICKVARA